MAVRQAVGAQARQIVRLVLGEGGRLIAIGLVLGVVAALFVGRLFETLLYEVSAADPPSLAGAAALLALVALGRAGRRPGGLFAWT